MKFATIVILKAAHGDPLKIRCSPFTDNKHAALSAARGERKRVMTNEPNAASVAVGRYNGAGDLVDVYTLEG